ncbi:STAS domain-containing protein [Streptomyces sp. NPDC058867]|uniref:STAS domain-containing protein n=1 Tax=unclassified Streptomyces TaxID=2593676 RepID=UPI003691185B
MRGSEPNGGQLMYAHLDVSVTTNRSCTVVSVVGELDRHTLHRITDVAEALTGQEYLVLDLRGLTFMDSSGLHLLLHLHRRVQAAGGSLELSGARRPVLRVLDLTGTRALFTFSPRNAA